MRCEAFEMDELRNFWIGAEWLTANYELRIPLRKLCNQPANDRAGWIILGSHAEKQLNLASIILGKPAPETLCRMFIRAIQRFQNRDAANWCLRRLI